MEGLDTCPLPERLFAYSVGNLSEHELEGIGDHLDRCPACSERLGGLQRRSDSFADAVGQAGNVEPFGTAECQRAVVGLNANSAPAQPLPSLLRDYRLLEKLGEGGMGVVYRALHTRLDRPVALKLLTGRRRHDPESAARFEREMKAVGRLRHPHIVQATDAGEIDGTPFLVMELLDGTDLAALVQRRGPLAAADACEIGRQAALALQHAHEHGLVHRDVKPSNLMLTAGGQVKLLDLGLALLTDSVDTTGSPPTVDAQVETTVAGTLVAGTEGYMAPEQFVDCRLVDLRADLYSLGCTLHFLLTGQPPPFKEPGAVERLATSNRLRRVLRRLLAPLPADRYASAGEVARALRPLARGPRLATLFGEETPPPRSIGMILSRRRLLGLGVGIATAVAGGAATWFLTRPAGRREVGGDDRLASPMRTEEPLPPPPCRLPMTADEVQEAQRAWAAHLGRRAIERDQLGLSLALIPTGCYQFSDACFARLSRPFFLAATEVTIGQFGRFAREASYETEAERTDEGGIFYKPPPSPRERTGRHYLWNSPGFPVVSDEHPVVQVSWNDAQAFCAWLSEKEGATYRLPTQVEWNWACRAGAAEPRFGDEGDLKRHAWTAGNFRGQPQPVGQLLANPWGLYDMVGNVAEWVLDHVDPRLVGDQIDPRGPIGKPAVALGVHYFGRPLKGMRVGTELRKDPSYRCNYIGFRVLRELPPRRL